jgi:aminoglycoside phosphotransferase (APT) family kinase protein
LLEPDAIVRTLIDGGFLTAADIVDKDVDLVDLGRSNPVHLVRIDTVGRLIVKQGQAVGSVFDAGFEREASVFRHAAGSVALARLMPRCLAVRPELRLLVLEFIDGTPAWAVEADGILETVELIVRLASTLGELHCATRSNAGFDDALPWVLRLFDDDRDALMWSHPDVRPLLNQAAERPRFVENLRGCRQSWRADCLIHGDVKFDNCLLLAAGGERSAFEVKFIDWELSVYGDPAWDLACLLENVVLRQVTAKAEVVWPAAVAKLARTALDRHCRACGAFDGVAKRLPGLVAACLLQTALRHATLTSKERQSFPAPIEPLIDASARIFSEQANIAAGLARGRA